MVNELKYACSRQKTRFVIVKDGFMDAEAFRDAISLSTTENQRKDIYKGVKEALEAWLDAKSNGIDKGSEIKGNCKVLFDNNKFQRILKTFAKIDDESIDFEVKNELIDTFGEYCALKGFEVDGKTLKVLFVSFDWWNYKNYNKSITVKENIAKMDMFLNPTIIDEEEFIKEKEFSALDKLIGGE